MVELLSYLRDKGFKTYIVSGGGVHFMRVFAERAYGIPSEQVLGTYSETSYKLIDGQPTITKEPGIAFLDDKEGKPINIDRIIGKRPLIAGGNSDGDYAMIEWTTAGDGPRLRLELCITRTRNGKWPTTATATSGVSVMGWRMARTWAG